MPVRGGLRLQPAPLPPRRSPWGSVELVDPDAPPERGVAGTRTLGPSFVGVAGTKLGGRPEVRNRLQSRRGGQRRGDGLAQLLGVLLVVVGTVLLLDVADAPAWVYLITGTAGLWWWARSAAQRRRERAAARARARAQRLLLWGIGGRRSDERPIDASSPLPRQWWEPSDLARRAVADYRACVRGLPAGPVRQRLLDGVTAMEDGAEELDRIVRRGAELDRQLRRFRRTGRWGNGYDGAEPADAPERVARLSRRVETARRRVDERLHALRVAALEAADVAVSMSLSDADDLVSGVEDTLSRVTGMATALDDTDTVSRPTIRSEEPSERRPRFRPAPAAPAASRERRRG
jgi:hypothetical protein